MQNLHRDSLSLRRSSCLYVLSGNGRRGFVTVTTTPRRLFVRRDLLRVDFALFEQPGLFRDHVCLPGGRADELGSQGIGEHAFGFLKRLAGRLREREDDVDQHGEVKHPEDNVHLPIDVFERGRDEVGQGEVEDPVAGRGQCHGFAPDAVGVQLWRVDPRHRTPCGSVGCHEQVGTSNDGLGRFPGDFPAGFGRVTTYAAGRSMMAVAGHETCVGEHESHHPDGPEDQRGASTPSVHE